jgi:hypothetical protein
MLMLEELENMTGAKTHQMFDLKVGTSTGAVVASMMGISCMGYSSYSRGVWWRGWVASSSTRASTTTWCWRRSSRLIQAILCYSTLLGPRRSPLCPSSPAWSPTRCSPTCSPTTALLMLVLYYILVNRLRLILSSNYCFQIFCFHSFTISS